MLLNSLYDNQFNFIDREDTAFTYRDIMDMPYHKFEEMIERLNKKNKERNKQIKEQQKQQEQINQNMNMGSKFKVPKFNVPKLRKF